MDWRPPPRPRWVDRLNGHADHVGDARSLVPLEPDELIDTATAQAGLDDFGDPGEFGDPGREFGDGAAADGTAAGGAGWWTHFEAFMEALEREGNGFNLTGRLLTRTDLLAALRNRLELVDLWRRRPDIGEQPIDGPLVVIGAARSGTSILHELLALDPAHSTPTTWKVHRPVAAATGDAATVAAARRSVDSVVSFWHDVQPEYETMHHNGGDLPTECIFLTVPTFLSDNWAGTHTVPSYSRHLAMADHRPAYEWHRRTLQTLSLRERGRRWVLKAPSHLATLRELFAVYPDARVIQLHRDPARTLPSMLSLMGTLRWMRTDTVDMEPFVEPTVAGVAHLQRRAIADRASGRLPDDRFFDLHYPELLADPVAAIGAAYEHFGLALPTSAARRHQGIPGVQAEGRQWQPPILARGLRPDRRGDPVGLRRLSRPIRHRSRGLRTAAGLAASARTAASAPETAVRLFPAALAEHGADHQGHPDGDDGAPEHQGSVDVGPVAIGEGRHRDRDEHEAGHDRDRVDAPCDPPMGGRLPGVVVGHAGHLVAH